jgi:hypothetical protein
LGTAWGKKVNAPVPRPAAAESANNRRLSSPCGWFKRSPNTAPRFCPAEPSRGRIGMAISQNGGCHRNGLGRRWSRSKAAHP